MKEIIDKAIRENLNIIVSHITKNGYSCNSRGRLIAQNANCIVMRDKHTNKRLSIPRKNIVKFEISEAHCPKFSYSKWWNDDTEEK